jgi:hypothetical protein
MNVNQKSVAYRQILQLINMGRTRSYTRTWMAYLKEDIPLIGYFQIGHPDPSITSKHNTPTHRRKRDISLNKAGGPVQLTQQLNNVTMNAIRWFYSKTHSLYLIKYRCGTCFLFSNCHYAATELPTRVE